MHESPSPQYLPRGVVPKCPNCGNEMQLAEENATSKRYICGCPPFGIVTVNVHRGWVGEGEHGSNS